MDLDGATVLVTGASGFVGGRLCASLVDAGAAVRAIVRRPATSPATDLAGVTEVVGDFTGAGELDRAADGCDAVVHAAASASGDLAADRHVNRDGTRRVVEAALAGGLRLVHISTGSVYAKDGVDVIDEDTPMVVDGDPYAVTKAEAEREVLAGVERGLAATILRPPAVLGWGETSTWGQRFPAMAAAGELPFTPAREATHAWVHVDDLADAAVVALRDDRAVGRTYNVVGGHGTWEDYLGAVLDIVGDAPDPFAGEARPAWTGRYDASRIADELGFTAGRGFDEALAETAARWGR